MEIEDFRKSDIKFLIELYRLKKITKRVQRSYRTGMAYYFGTWSLRDWGMIKCDGTDNRRQKVYTLTEKGKRVAELLTKLKVILNEK